MDYDSLLKQIQNYANKKDNSFIAAIPDFISMG